MPDPVTDPRAHLNAIRANRASAERFLVEVEDNLRRALAVYAAEPLTSNIRADLAAAAGKARDLALDRRKALEALCAEEEEAASRCDFRLPNLPGKMPTRNLAEVVENLRGLTLFDAAESLGMKAEDGLGFSINNARYGRRSAVIEAGNPLAAAVGQLAADAFQGGWDQTLSESVWQLFAKVVRADRGQSLPPAGPNLCSMPISGDGVPLPEVEFVSPSFQNDFDFSGLRLKMPLTEAYNLHLGNGLLDEFRLMGVLAARTLDVLVSKALHDASFSAATQVAALDASGWATAAAAWASLSMSADGDLLPNPAVVLVPVDLLPKALELFPVGAPGAPKVVVDPVRADASTWFMLTNPRILAGILLEFQSWAPLPSLKLLPGGGGPSVEWAVTMPIRASVVNAGTGQPAGILKLTAA
jgi:hypothetical protein